jgi:hypothetical protein
MPDFPTRRRRGLAPVLAAAALLLAGCSGLNDLLGTKKTSPDEFSVVKRAPLVLPPNYNLRPPAPGMARPQELQPTQAAQAAVLASAGRKPATVEADKRSPGELALMRGAKAENVDPGIRQTIDRETTAMVDADQSFTDRLIFWRETRPQGEIVDAAEEARRIRENQAAGRSVVEGSTPVIRHRRRGLLEGIF